MSTMGPWGGMPIGGPASSDGLLQEAALVGDMAPFGEEKVNVGPSARRRLGQWNPPIGGFVPKHRTRTVRQLLSMMMKLDGDRLFQLQSRMYNAGLYDKKPVWGYVTEETVTAYKRLITEAAIHPDQGISEVLDSLEEAAIRGDERFGGGKSGGTVTLSNPDDVMADADALAQKILGKKLTKKQKEFLVAWQQGQERTAGEAQIAASDDGAGTEEIDAFMAAVMGRESSGDPTVENQRTGAAGLFQIMPENWPKWAPLAGLAPNSDVYNAENQKKVARAVMGMYYKQFKNWRDVAIAWYAGPGAASDPRKRDRNAKQGRGNEPSINEYADQVMERFLRNRSTPGAPGITEIVSPGGVGAMSEQIRRLNPVAAAGMDFAGQMTEFEQLLGGA